MRPDPRRRQLEAARDDLRRRLSRLSVHVEAGGGSGDFIDGAHAMEQEDTATRGVEIVARELGQVERALQRCDEGRYGVCVDCDGRIAPVRLRALPEATRCLRCQRAAESGAN